MFHPALWKLLKLQWYGSLRQFAGSLRTTRGLIMAGFMIALMLYGVGSIYFASRVMSGGSPFGGTFDKLQNSFLTMGLFVFTTGILLFSTGDAVVFFTPSEVAFLFPAPLTRKQLLTFKLLKSLAGILAVSLFFSLFAASQFHLIPMRIVATILTISFLQLLTMNVAFSRYLVQEKLHLMVRRVLGVLLAIPVFLAVQQGLQFSRGTDLLRIIQGFQQSAVGGWILSPFHVFVQMLRASDWLTFLPYALIVFVIDLILLTLAYQLDGLSLEAALATSERVAARMKAVQTKGVWQAFGTSTSEVATRKLPQLPFWGGIGPIVWQKLTTTLRSSTKLVWILGVALAVAASIVYMIGNSKGDAHLVVAAGVVSMAYLSFLICLSIQNEIERVGYLKSLPIRAGSVVLGELLGFVVILSVIEATFLAIVAGFFSHFAVWLLIGAAFALPLNFLLFGIDKLIFYVYPTRLAKAAPGDFQSAGRQMVFLMMKVLMIGAALLIVLIAALPIFLVLQSPVLALISAAVVLLIECVALVPLLVQAFDKFDPGTALSN